jgi:hypothetical protein
MDCSDKGEEIAEWVEKNRLCLIKVNEGRKDTNGGGTQREEM